MNLPQSSNLRCSSLLRMFKILEWQSQDTDRNGLHQIPTMARVQPKSLLLELRLNIATIGAIFAIHGCFDNYARCILVGYLRNFQVNVAVLGIHACILKIRELYLDQLQLATEPRLGRWQNWSLRPRQNCVYSDLRGRAAGNRNVFRCMPIVGNVGQEWMTIAEILQLTEYTARNTEEGQQQYTPQPAQLPGGFHSSYDATQIDRGDEPSTFHLTCCFELVPSREDRPETSNERPRRCRDRTL